MKAIKRGCLEIFVIWALAGFGLYVAFTPRFEPPGHLYGAIGGGFLISCAWGLVRNSVIALKQRRQIIRCRDGQPPEHGKTYAADGPLVLLKDPLLAPFTKRACVIHGYEFFHRHTRTLGDGKTRETCFEKDVFLSGYGMAPCAIKTPAGDMQLMGFPVPEAFPEETLNAGTQVCVIGKYDALKKGLIQDFNTGGLEMFPGDTASGIRNLAKRATSGFFFALFLFCLGTAGVGFLLKAREGSEEIRKTLEKRFIQALDANDPVMAEKWLKRGVSPNLIDPSNVAAVFHVTSRGMFMLLRQYGFDPNQPDANGYPPLLNAVQQGRRQIAEWLLEAGANANQMHAGWRVTPLESAYDNADWLMVEMLARAGGRGIVVPIQRQYLTQTDTMDFMPLIRRYWAALEAGNPEEARQVTDGWPADFFKGVARRFYANARPREPAFFAALIQQDAAVVFTTGDSARDLYVHVLKKKAGTWRIARESWDDRGVWRNTLAELE